jgi:hypothetical protein
MDVVYQFQGVEFEWDPDKEKPMSKEISSEMDDDLRPEYDLSQLLKGGVRGKYADRFRKGTNLVLLAPDVAQAFPTEEAVNEALRLVMQIANLPIGRRIEQPAAR